jgi:hypothetical protein
MKKIIAGLVLILPTAQALAEFPTGKAGVSFSPVVDLTVDSAGGSEDGDGNALGFYGQLGNGMFFGYADARMSALEVDSLDVDLDETRFGVGVRGSNDTGYLEGRLEQYEVELDVEGPSEAADDDGLGVHVGGGIPLSPQFEVFGRVGVLSLDDTDGNEFQLGVSGEVSTNLEVYGLYRMLSLEDDADVESDLDELRLGLNLLF